MALENLLTWNHHSASGKGVVAASAYTITACDASDDTEFIAKQPDYLDGDFGPFSVGIIETNKSLYNNISVLLLSNYESDRAGVASLPHLNIQAFADAGATQRYTMGQWSGATWDGLSGNYYYAQNIKYTHLLSRIGNSIVDMIYQGEVLKSTLIINPVVRAWSWAAMGAYGDIDVSNRYGSTEYTDVDIGLEAGGILPLLDRFKMLAGMRQGMNRGQLK